MANLFGRNRRRTDERLRTLRAGGAVSLDCQLRRTSPRGWGPWTPGHLELGAVGGEAGAGVAVWGVTDPLAVGLPALHGPVRASFAPGAQLWVRPVRFATETFWGRDSRIVVVEDDRHTAELAFEPVLVDEVARRLSLLLEAGPGA